jgi:hypothetical protein
MSVVLVRLDQGSHRAFVLPACTTSATTPPTVFFMRV